MPSVRLPRSSRRPPRMALRSYTVADIHAMITALTLAPDYLWSAGFMLDALLQDACAQASKKAPPWSGLRRRDRRVH
jgi:hypothetical protein